MSESGSQVAGKEQENFSYFMASFLLQPTATTRRPLWLKPPHYRDEKAGQRSGKRHRKEGAEGTE